MNTLQKGLIGAGLVALLAGCSAGVGKKSTPAENSGATSTEMTSEAHKTPSGEAIDPELLSSIEVKLSDGKVELSESRVNAGHLEFDVRNDTTEPLHMAVVKTNLEPTEIVVREGKVDRTQAGVEVLSELRDNPIKPGHEETLIETLEPGEYTVVVTSPSQSKPVAYSALTLQPE
ncbi:hypothetical protein IQ254_02085 [Nodosilinea sp. LEGE 07088]|uniref:hypothetical protein n=1 Tax=Nodosilinea sp. LEGE 07088 TaxID=2777968 RepID=UPI0018825587|nr:hypothetical protein [Nodosilinea sp. LEGE 07088]MBE9136003.1 hypothetical protein [Nodosilinea sp. LEGE 07088]